MKGWVGLVESHVVYSGRFTHISGHPSAVGRAQDRESSLVKDRRSNTVPRNQPINMVYHVLMNFLEISGRGRSLYRQQEAQLLQRDRAMLLNISLSHSRSLKITQGHLKWHPWVERVSPCLYLLPFLRYSASVLWRDLEIWVTGHFLEGHWKWYHSKPWVRFPVRIP